MEDYRAHKTRPCVYQSSRSTSSKTTSLPPSRAQSRFRRPWQGEETEDCSHKTRPRISPSSRSTSTSSSSSKTTKSLSSQSSPSSGSQGRFRRPWEGDETEDCSIKCTGKGCQACSATLMADCVALCCCPLALVSLLALTFIKVPYVMGRKCLRRRRTKRIKEKTTKTAKEYQFEGNGDIVFEFGEEGEMMEQRKSLCTGLIELDNVLLELYQVGHLGFGRVSFTGIQPNSKA